jgi:hypothetical protein
MIVFLPNHTFAMGGGDKWPDDGPKETAEMDVSIIEKIRLLLSACLIWLIRLVLIWIMLISVALFAGIDPDKLIVQEWHDSPFSQPTTIEDWLFASSVSFWFALILKQLAQ